jgi:hypothetical protein
MPITKKHISPKGWKGLTPNTHERTLMKAKCGTKCFLGPPKEKCFPICAKGTCKINKKGLMAAYIRARQQASMTKKRKRGGHTKKVYNHIAARAKKMLNNIGYTVGVI